MNLPSDHDPPTGVDTSRQLPLALQLENGATFENFVASGNEEVLSIARAMVAGIGLPFLYLCGGEGTGKTHLLAASCHCLAHAKGTVAHLPLRQISVLNPALIAGLEQLDLLCIDDIDAIAGDRAWEEELFHLYNRLERVGGRLIVASRIPPSKIEFKISDLGSRLTSGVVFRLRSLDDESRAVVLRSRAEQRGFEIPDEVVAFLLKRCPRDLHTLASLVERIDYLTLTAKRRVTIPFVKSLFAELPRGPRKPTAND